MAPLISALRSVCCRTGEASIEAANSSASMPPQARPSAGSAGVGREATWRPSRIRVKDLSPGSSDSAGSALAKPL